MSEEELQFYKEIIYADKVFDINFQNISKKLYKEIERLNKELDKTRLSELNKEYIINELEKWLGKKILSWEDDGNVSDNIYHERLAIQMIYFKLQELKRSNSNE